MHLFQLGWKVFSNNSWELYWRRTFDLFRTVNVFTVKGKSKGKSFKTHLFFVSNYQLLFISFLRVLCILQFNIFNKETVAPFCFLQLRRLAKESRSQWRAKFVFMRVSKRQWNMQRDSKKLGQRYVWLISLGLGSVFKNDCSGDISWSSSHQLNISVYFLS